MPLPAAERPLLSVAIPTWNRGAHLEEAVRAFQSFAAEAITSGKVEIVVSDNGSTDGTLEICNRLGGGVRVVRHAVNRGFDLNALSVYEEARGLYVLFFSDDDLPERDLVHCLLEIIERNEPAMVLFGFAQPPYGEVLSSLGDGPEIELRHDAGQALESILKFTKLSTYCLRKVDWREDRRAEIFSKAGTDYLFLTLAAATIVAEPERPTVLYRRVLARARPDCNRGFRFDLDVFTRKPVALGISGVAELIPAPVLGGLAGDPLAHILANLSAHYAGELTFEKDAVSRAERRVRDAGWRVVRPDRLDRYLQYVVARHVRPAWLSRLLRGLLSRLHRLVSLTARLLYSAARWRHVRAAAGENGAAPCS
jgi:glycosyltransferase involved in cell wall biosynthesis